MDKREFLDQLHSAISDLPPQEIDEQLSFYGEMIDDLMEEGLRPEEAVCRIGSVDTIAAQIKAEQPLKRTILTEAKRSYSLPLWAIILLVISAPVWGSLLIGLLSVIFGLFVIIVCAVIGLWAISVGIACCAFAGLVVAGLQFFLGKTVQGIFFIGAALLCAGLAILLVMASVYTGKAIASGCRKLVLHMKKHLVRKEAAQ